MAGDNSSLAQMFRNGRALGIVGKDARVVRFPPDLGTSPGSGLAARYVVFGSTRRCQSFLAYSESTRLV